MLLFNQLAEALEEISQHRSRNKIVELLGQLFRALEAEEARDAAYLLLGTLGATYAPIRFNLADKQLFAFLQIFVAETFGEVAVATFRSIFERVGDLGQALYLLSSECGENKVVPVLKETSFLEVFEVLREIALRSGVGSAIEKRDLLFVLLRRVSPAGQKYLIKIVGGQLRLGFSVSTLLESFSLLGASPKSFKKLLENNYHVCADVGLIIFRLKSLGVEALNNPMPRTGIPVCPAAAERVADLAELLERQQDFVVQPKLDGLRVQIHKSLLCDGGKVSLFSRNLLDITAMLPEVVQAFEAFPVYGFIVEGEALGYDEVSNSDSTFQATSQRRRKHDVLGMAERLPVRVFIFDVLMLENSSCLALPYTQRRARLQGAFLVENPPCKLVTEGEFSCAKGTQQGIEDTKAGVFAFFQLCISRGYEGIVAKRKEGLYEPGKRGFNWIKIKHLAECKVRDTVDAVIIGFFLGKGRRAELGLGALLVAIYNSETGTLQTLAKVGTGLTDADLSSFWLELKELQLPEKPVNYDVANNLKPDGWVVAKVVVEIEADDLTLSKVHTAAWNMVVADRGLALRFPCLKRRRPDKMFEQTTTPAELVRLVALRNRALGNSE